MTDICAKWQVHVSAQQASGLRQSVSTDDAAMYLPDGFVAQAAIHMSPEAASIAVAP